MIYGLDYLGGAKYPDVVLKCHPKGWAAGFFAEEFGDAFPLIEKLLKTGKCPHVRIHLLWEGTHKYGDKHIPTIKSLGRICQSLAEKYTSVKVEVSPFCEHWLAAPDKYLDITQSVAPNCTIVNSPDGNRGALSKKYKNEVHHAKPVKGGNFSHDGQNCVDVFVRDDIEACEAADVDVLFFWWCRFNLHYHMKDSQRKAKPTVKDTNSIIYLATNPGTITVPKTKPPWIIKSHAENHGPTNGKDDVKGDKLCIISPINAPEIILKRGSKKIATLKNFGTYKGGGWRYYYLSGMGFELGANLDVWMNGKKVAKINGGFRAGLEHE